LEQVPRGVVQKENALEADDRSHEHDVRDWRSLECHREMLEVCIYEEPLFK
jgi:hypothetical protein